MQQIRRFGRAVGVRGGMREGLRDAMRDGGGPRPTRLGALRVRPLVTDRTKGQVLAGGSVVPCALGRSGIAQVKREGDGASPRGVFRLRGGVFRPDRPGGRPGTGLRLRATRPQDGWCDDPADRRYNRPIRLPARGAGADVSAERLWREDGLYEIVVDLDYNRGPIRPRRGSAIFLHVARPGYEPTEGCVALERADLVRLLRRLGPRTRMAIGAPAPARQRPLTPKRKIRL